MEGGGKAYSFVDSLSCMTIDHASLARGGAERKLNHGNIQLLILTSMKIITILKGYLEANEDIAP